MNPAKILAALTHEWQALADVREKVRPCTTSSGKDTLLPAIKGMAREGVVEIRGGYVSSAMNAGWRGQFQVRLINAAQPQKESRP